ncbi:hypothetical protein KPH14_006103 [Odynerus spinipes]|uniref:Uncharacterized protein n=1 Tax=Odynerus spinipes TaxID=1348599 RepID=A0AAD9VP93_9HYME|nr:hypothetical protein KPH14_006103 [Odynerus spinipes]
MKVKKANEELAARPICFGPLEDVGAVCLDIGLMYGQPIIIAERMEGRMEYISWKRKRNRTKGEGAILNKHAGLILKKKYLCTYLLLPTGGN